MTKEKFIEAMATLVIKYAPNYGIKVYSPIIAQGILESGWGKSKLAADYHNYFGLKCGSQWTGRSVNMTTKEEYTPGTKTTIKDNFRAYDNMEEGVRGYFEFLRLKRYQNLRGITDPEEYLKTIKADGYATSSTYVSDLMKVIRTYDLTKYDKEEKKEEKPKTAKKKKEEAEEYVVTERDITICGHGSGTPSLKNLYEYAEKRYQQRASNGKHKGIVAVKRHKDMTEKKAEEFVEAYKMILGRNHYSQALRGYVYTRYRGTYYSDCSSSGMAAMRRIGLSIGPWLLNTAGIYESPKFETVPVIIKDGHIQNPEILKVGDPILFVGNDPSRPEQIGHVEYVYSINKKSGKANKDRKSFPGTYPSLANGRGYYVNGDGKKTLTNYKTQIKRIQQLVNWINTGNMAHGLAVDGHYGEKTVQAVKKAQGLLGVKIDGVFGKATLTAAKAYKR
jgi:hypothetical protein